MNEYQELKSLKADKRYAMLQALWAHDAEAILKSISAASRTSGKDSSLRYYAGKWDGFNAAIGHLDRALAEMEKENNNKRAEDEIDKTLDEIRGLRKPQGGRK